MYKRALILLLLTLCLVFPIQVSADRQSTSVSIDVSFGDRTFTNVFDVSWDTEEVYRPCGYGSVNDDRYTVIRNKKEELNSDIIKVLQGPFTFRIIDSMNVNAESIVEIIASKDGETYRGFIYGSYWTTSLNYLKNGGLLESEELQPKGIFVAPKKTRYYPYYYPNFHSDADGAYGANYDVYYEYVDKYGDWYKTANGLWFSNEAFYELSDTAMNSLFGSDNPILFRYGDIDPKIKIVQEKLNITTTSQLDDNTYGRLRSYQNQNGLIPSGLIDKETLESFSL